MGISIFFVTNTQKYHYLSTYLKKNPLKLDGREGLCPRSPVHLEQTEAQPSVSKLHALELLCDSKYQSP